MAGKSTVIGATIKLSGEKEFTSAVRSSSNELKTMKSALKLVETEVSGSANSLESLTKKHDALEKAVEASRKKEESISSALDHAREDYDRVGKELDDYKAGLEEARKRLDEMKASGDASNEELQQQEQQVQGLTAAVEKGESAYQKAGERVQNWERQLNDAKVETANINGELRDNNRYMEEAKQSADGCASSIDEYGKKSEAAAKKTEHLSDEVINQKAQYDVLKDAMDAAGQAAVQMADKAYSAARELDKGYDTIITKTGASGDALKGLQSVADDIYGSLPVEMEQVGAAVGEVNTRFGQTGDALKETSTQFLEFAQINQTDVSSAVGTVNRLMREFGVEADETGNVLGILTKRGQETGISVSDLMSALDANAETLKALNLGFDESVNLLAAFEANGVESSTAIKGLQRAVVNYAKEGKNAREGLNETINSIKDAKTNTEALAIAQETFGTRGAVAITGAIRDGRLSVEDLTDSMSSYGDTVKSTFNETLNGWDKATIASNNLKAAGSDLVGEFFEAAAPVIEKVTDAVKDVTKWFKGLPEPAKKVISALGALTAAATVVGPKIVKVGAGIKTLQAAKEASNAIKALTGAQEAANVVTEAAAAAQEANTIATAAGTAATEAQTVATGAAEAAQLGFNAAMLANPIVLVTAGIVAGTAALALFAAGTDETQTKVNALIESADAANEALKDSQERLEESAQSAKETIDTASASAEMSGDMIEELRGLASQTSLTTGEQERMRAIVTELNTLYPEMGLKINEVTGKLNKSDAELKQYAEDLKNTAMQAAYQEALQEELDGSTDAIKEQIKAKAELNKIQSEEKRLRTALSGVYKQQANNEKELTKKQNELSEALKTGAEDTSKLQSEIDRLSSGYVYYNGKLQDAGEVTTEIKNQLDELGNTEQELSDNINENEGVITEAKEKALEYADAYNQILNEANGANEAQNQYAEGATNAAEASDSATSAINARTEASKASIETAGQELTVFQGLSESQQQLALDVTNAVLTMEGNVQSSLESQMNMFEEFNGGAEVETGTVLENMRKQVEGVHGWEQELIELAGRTDDTGRKINAGLLQHLAELGPQGASMVAAFNNMTGEELTKANSLWQQSLDIKGFSDETGQQLMSELGTSVASGFEGTDELMAETGANTVQGLVNGVTEAQQDAEAAGEELGGALMDGTNAGCGTQSPSKKTFETGKNVVQGLVNGLNDRKGVISAGNAVGNSAISAIQTGSAKANVIGHNIALGVAEGIRTGTASVIVAAANMASQALLSAKRRLGINSPSTAFKELGKFTDAGYIAGIKSGKPDIARAISETFTVPDSKVNVDYSMANAKAGTADGGVPVSEMLAAYLPYLPYLAQIAAKDLSLDGKAVTKSVENHISASQIFRQRAKGV